MAPFLEPRAPRFGIEAHDAGDAPDDALAEPTRQDMPAGLRGEQQLALTGGDAAGAEEVFAAGTDQGPDHRHRRARQGAAADADRGAIGHERCRLSERHDLLAQAAVALSGASAKLGVIQRQQPSPKPAFALNSAINPSQAAAACRNSLQKPWLRRLSNSASGTPCCSTQVK